MKLGTLKDGSRDGTLVVVSKDLGRAVKVPDIASTLQSALDAWPRCWPLLDEVYRGIEGNASAFELDLRLMAAPLPRAFQWVDGSAYVNHVELVRKARGAIMPENLWRDPLMYQGCSDSFLGPCDEASFASEDWGIDFESEVAVICDDVSAGIPPEQAESHIKLIALVNDLSLRNLIPSELAKGFGFLQSKPTSAFSPVAATPDELGNYWRDGKVNLPLRTSLNGKLVGEPNAGVDMTFNFPQLISHAARTRRLAAGTIVGSGTISNTDRSKGSSCLAEKRMIEKIDRGKIETSFLRDGDRIRIEMLDQSGRSIFGAIDQQIVIDPVATEK